MSQPQTNQSNQPNHSKQTKQTKSFMPSWLPAVNKKIVNPIQGLWAPYLPPYLMIHHVGRVSGRQFKTPVVAFKRGERLYVCLLYGSESQWVKNVVAAGGATATRAGRSVKLTTPEVVRRGDFAGSLPFQTKALGKNLGILIVQIQSATPDPRGYAAKDGRAHR